jgi:hypothetical protein
LQKIPKVSNAVILKSEYFGRKFPYGLYYIWENDEVAILAFWHSKEDIPNKLREIL